VARCYVASVRNIADDQPVTPLVTVIELFVVALYLAVGRVGGDLLSEALGWLGWPLGFGLGLLAMHLLVGLLGVLEYQLTGSGSLPACETGRCSPTSSWGDYAIEWDDGELLRVCGCGLRYRREGRRFLRRPEDGDEYSLAIWRPFRGWCAERDQGRLTFCVEDDKAQLEGALSSETPQHWRPGDGD